MVEQSPGWRLVQGLRLADTRLSSWQWLARPTVFLAADGDEGDLLTSKLVSARDNQFKATEDTAEGLADCFNEVPRGYGTTANSGNN